MRWIWYFDLLEAFLFAYRALYNAYVEKEEEKRRRSIEHACMHVCMKQHEVASSLKRIYPPCSINSSRDGRKKCDDDDDDDDDGDVVIIIRVSMATLATHFMRH